MARNDEDKFELGSETMKRLNEMHGKAGIVSKDIKNARAAGMSDAKMKRQYDRHLAEGGRIHQGAQARMEGMRKYDSLDDFDADHIAGHNLNPNRKRRTHDVSGMEMINLLKNNEFDAREVNQMVKDRNLSLGNRAQNRLNKELAKLGSKMPTDITDPGDGTPVITTLPIPTIGDSFNQDTTQTQTQKIDNTMEMPQTFLQGSDKFNDSDTTNTFGDGATIYGSFIGGGLDQSINIGTQSGKQSLAAGQSMDDSGAVTIEDGGGTGAMGLGGRGIDNIGSGVATMGLLENLYGRQNVNFSASGRAASTIDAAEKDTDVTDRLNKLNYVYGYPKYNEDKAIVTEGRYLGDLDAFPTPDWVNTADPEKYDLDDLNKVADKYKV